MSAVEFSGVDVALAGRPVLKDIDLTIAPGEFIGVLGANGAGKTTLLRAILGLIAPLRGQIRVLGGPAIRGNPAVGYLPQLRPASGELRLCGRDFVTAAAGGQRWGLPLPSRAERREVECALGMVGAVDLAQRPLSEMSGGERQRLSLAQALLGRPRLLLLDEPLSGLDPQYQRAVVALVGELGRTLGIAVLFSAHELNPLLGALDRVLYLAGGRAALGSVAEVITGPVLSRLYGAPMEVLRSGERIFVVTGEARQAAMADA